MKVVHSGIINGQDVRTVPYINCIIIPICVCVEIFPNEQSLWCFCFLGQT